MTDRVDEILSQLKKIAPLPDDESLSEEILGMYEKIINELSSFQDSRTIQPLINSFGYGTGYGTYWSVVHLLERFDHEQLDPLLISALQHAEPGPRMWAALILGRSRNRAAIPFLIPLLNAPEELVRSHAVSALRMMGEPSTREYIERLRNDSSREVRSAVERALIDLG
jgi:hypothetical protein